jgi:hypothetical protein
MCIMVSYADQVFVNHDVICLVSDYELLCVLQSQWFWIMCAMLSQWMSIIARYADLVVVNHGELSWACCCESWWCMVSQCLWIMVGYAVPVDVNHGVLKCVSGCESTGAWGMDFLSSSPLFSTTTPFSKFAYKSFLFQYFHNHSFFLHLTISVDVIHHE